MNIEFIGLPGSGKTTLHGKLLERLRKMGIPVRTAQSARSEMPSDQLSSRLTHQARSDPTTPAKLSRATRVSAYLKAAWVYKRAVLLAARQLFLGRRPLGDKWFGFRLFVVALGRSCEARDSSFEGQVSLLDEGPIQRAFTVFVNGAGEVNHRAAIRYAQLVPLPDVLVYVKVITEVALYRLQERQRGLPVRFQLEEPESVAWVLAQAEQMLDQIASELQQQGVKVITVESDNPKEVERRVFEGVVSSLPWRTSRKVDPEPRIAPCFRAE